ncbi:hypothetical protein [Spirosoma knui]
MKTKVKVLAVASLLLSGLFAVDSPDAQAQVPRSNRVVIPRTTAVRQVWIPGHYVRRGRDYLWVEGYYKTTPVAYRTYSKPARYKTWNSGYWRQTRRGPVWVEGYWSY